jgi:hypothetical protein
VGFISVIEIHFTVVWVLCVMGLLDVLLWCLAEGDGKSRAELACKQVNGVRTVDLPTTNCVGKGDVQRCAATLPDSFYKASSASGLYDLNHSV